MQQKKSANIKTSIIYSGSIGILIGIIVSYIFFSSIEPQEQVESESQRSISNNYEFIEPLLECEDTSDTKSRKYIPFEKELKQSILDYQTKNHPNTELSLYFRDLRNGPWFSINYQEWFYPASLLKMPTLIGYVRWAEIDPSILGKKIKVEKLTDYVQNIQPEKSAEIGKEYSVEELLELMVLYSDNNASNSLLAHMPWEIESDVFSTLQVPSPRNETAETYKINVKEFASFFRILYNASYLTNAGSEAVLNLLSRVTFNKWITGKLPKDVKVAHKFWERIYTEKDGSGNEVIKSQLHDCGIIYYTDNPYLLCMMTRGDSLDELSMMTQDISKMIYDTWDTTRKQAKK